MYFTHHMDLHRYKPFSSFIIILGTISSCIGYVYAENYSDNQAKSSNEENKIVLNVIHSDDIRAIMRRLNLLAYEREYTDLELEQKYREQIELLIQTANKLKDSAENLPNITRNKINETDITTFRAMANQLYRETLNLQEEINSSHYRGIRLSYQRLRDTCNACHQLFRDR